MNRRNFLGTLASSLVGALMIRSLGQVALALPEPDQLVTVEIERRYTSHFVIPGGTVTMVAGEDLEPGDLIRVGGGKAYRATGPYAVPVGIVRSPVL